MSFVKHIVAPNKKFIDFCGVWGAQISNDVSVYDRNWTETY